MPAQQDQLIRVAAIGAVGVARKAGGAPVEHVAVQAEVESLFGSARLIRAEIQDGTTGKAGATKPATTRVEKILIDHRDLGKIITYR